MPKPSPIDGTTTTAARSIAAWIGDTWPRKCTASAMPSSRASAFSAGSSGPRPAISSSRSGSCSPRLRERAQQDDVALDRDQPADAEQPRHVAGVRRGLAVRVDAVVDDLERLVVEALDVLEVAREPARDRDVHVREARERAVGEPEVRRLAELVEAVLRREAQRHARDGAGEQPVRVGVHEMRVQDRRPHAHEVRGRAGRTRPDRSPRAAESRRAGRRARVARARSPTRRARSRAASACARPSRARAAAAAATSRCASEPEMPATFCRWRIVSPLMRVEP